MLDISTTRTALPPTHPRSSLHAFLQGMLSRRIEIVHQRAAETALRPTLEGNRLALPAGFWPRPARDTLCRAVAAHALAHWRYSPAAQTLDGLKPIGRSVAEAVEDARVEALLLRDYPGLRMLWTPHHEADESSGLSLNALLARLARALFDANYRDGNFWIDKARRLFDAQRGDLGNYRNFRSLASVLANDLGQMRVRFEPDSGQFLRYRDDNVWLWETKVEAIVVATPESTETIDGQPSGAASGAASEMPTESDDVPQTTSLHTYPEWDYRQGHEHPHWATVLERAPTLGTLDAALSARIEADRLAWQPRRPVRRSVHPTIVRRRHLQYEGDILHIDSVIALQVALRRGLPPDLRVFSVIHPSLPEISVLILLDLSASTDLRAAALEKRAACQLAERWCDGRSRVAIHGFCSDGRHQVFYHRFKDFDAPFDDACRDRLLRARSELSTRTGAALRHAITQIRTELPRRVKILLVGDGEPADIDVFDPHYLQSDASHVIHAARQRGIDILSLSFANRAIIPDAGDGAKNKDADDTEKNRKIYSASTFAAAMARAHDFIAH
ncbi:MAG: nitric oxide reductase activation protein [Proteobacteria bacterium]|nr:nitric oxide reductase activation protein [Pseudomonadota bacterium]